MVVAKITVKDINDYKLVSKLAEYSANDEVIVDIYDRCKLDVPSILFAQCIGMLYSKGVDFTIDCYYDTTDNKVI